MNEELIAQYDCQGNLKKKDRDYSSSLISTPDGNMTHSKALKRGYINEIDMYLNQNVYRGGYYID